MTSAATLSRAYVNNGGDIALHLAPGETFVVGHGRAAGSSVAFRHGHAGSHSRFAASRPAVGAAAVSPSESPMPSLFSPIARPWRTPLQPSSRMPSICRDIRSIVRVPARDLAPDSDLGDRLVTQRSGRSFAHPKSPPRLTREMLSPQIASVGQASFIRAALRLQGETRVVGGHVAKRSQCAAAQSFQASRSLVHA